MFNAFDSPFVVPVAGCAMSLGIVCAGLWSAVRHRQIQSEERLAAIAAGLPMPPTPGELVALHGRPQGDTRRRHGNIRLTGIVLLSVAAGIILFFTALAVILHERNVLCGAAIGLIPLAIGVGFMIDARLKARELEALEDGTPSLRPSLN